MCGIILLPLDEATCPYLPVVGCYPWSLKWPFVKRLQQVQWNYYYLNHLLPGLLQHCSFLLSHHSQENINLSSLKNELIHQPICAKRGIASGIQEWISIHNHHLFPFFAFTCTGMIARILSGSLTPVWSHLSSVLTKALINFGFSPSVGSCSLYIVLSACLICRTVGCGCVHSWQYNFSLQDLLMGPILRQLKHKSLVLRKSNLSLWRDFCSFLHCSKIWSPLQKIHGLLSAVSTLVGTFSFGLHSTETPFWLLVSVVIVVKPFFSLILSDLWSDRNFIYPWTLIP